MSPQLIQTSILTNQKAHVLLILTVFTRAKVFQHFELCEPEAGAPRAPSLARSGKRNLWKTEAISTIMEKFGQHNYLYITIPV